MHSFAFIAVSLALVVAVSAEPKEDIPHNDFFTETGRCIPGQRFVDKCNSCFCGPDGNGAACTKMACRPVEKPHIDGFSSAEGLACLPGTKFFDGCNACSCSKSGKTAICTLAADCNVHARSRRSAGSNVPHIDNFDESQKCTPGQQFYNQCNTCTCSADGKNAACTFKACPPSDKIRIDNYAEVQKCPAGKTFYDKCNSCRCGADGASAFCTLIACPEFQ